MSSVDRIKTAAYTSPGGTRTEFRYSNQFNKEFTHKIGAFNFSDLSGTYYQDNGITSDNLPITLHFAGSDHDTEANDFEDTLKEKGHGILEHPVYGVKNVQVGRIRRIDDPQNRYGITTFELEFFETLELQPEATEEFNARKAEIEKNNTNLASAETFENNLDISTVTKITNAKDKFQEKLDLVDNKLSTLSNLSNEISIQFTQGLGDMTSNLDTLIRNPLELAQQMQTVSQLPTLATDSLNRRFNSYRELLFDVLELDGNGNSALASQNVTTALKNDISIAEVFSVATMGALISSASLSTYATRAEALETAEILQNDFDTMSNTLDTLQGNFSSEILFDQYFSQSDSFQEIRTFLFDVVADIQKRALDLKIEKRITLKKATHYITVCNQYYDSVSNETLSFFENTNNLTGDDYYLLKKGKEIVIFI